MRSRAVVRSVPAWTSEGPGRHAFDVALTFCYTRFVSFTIQLSNSWVTTRIGDGWYALVAPVMPRRAKNVQENVKKNHGSTICYKPPESNREPSVRPRALILQLIVRQKS